MSIILAIDPSLTCTGWAVLDRLDHVGFYGTVTTSARKPYLDRVHETIADLAGIAAQHGVERIVIETPATVMAGGRNRSVVSGATYGFIAGAVYAHLRIATRTPVEGVAATVWTQYLGKAKGTKNDRDKVKRVRAVEYYYRELSGKLGAKSKAGNIADAILLGRWWFNQRCTSASSSPAPQPSIPLSAKARTACCRARG